MGTDDKLSNKAEDLTGRAKEATGALTGDEQTKHEGKVDQAKSAAKDAGEHVKDAAHKIKDAIHKRR